MTRPSRSVVRFYNKRGIAEQWIKEGQQATNGTRLSGHRFRANEVRLQWSVLAYNRGNGLPARPEHAPRKDPHHTNKRINSREMRPLATKPMRHTPIARPVLV